MGYVGGIDEVAVYGQALTPTEVADHYATLVAGDDTAMGRRCLVIRRCRIGGMDETVGPSLPTMTGANPGAYQGTPRLRGARG